MHRRLGHTILYASVYSRSGDPRVAVDYDAGRKDALALWAPSSVYPATPTAEVVERWITGLDALLHPFAVQRLRAHLQPDHGAIALPNLASLTCVLVGAELLAQTRAPLRGAAVAVHVGAVPDEDGLHIRASASARPVTVQGSEALRAAASAYEVDVWNAWAPAVIEFLAPWMRAEGVHEFQIAGRITVPTTTSA